MLFLIFIFRSDFWCRTDSIRYRTVAAKCKQSRKTKTTNHEKLSFWFRLSIWSSFRQSCNMGHSSTQLEKILFRHFGFNSGCLRSKHFLAWSKIQNHKGKNPRSQTPRKRCSICSTRWWNDRISFTVSFLYLYEITFVLIFYLYRWLILYILDFVTVQKDVNGMQFYRLRAFHQNFLLDQLTHQWRRLIYHHQKCTAVRQQQVAA